jgi:hypothetical protein
MNYCMVVNQNVRCFLKLSLVLVPEDLHLIDVKTEDSDACASIPLLGLLLSLRFQCYFS